MGVDAEIFIAYGFLLCIENGVKLQENLKNKIWNYENEKFI